MTNIILTVSGPDSASELDAYIQTANTQGVAGDTYTIVLNNNVTLSQDLTALASAANVTFESSAGNDYTVSGANAFSGLSVQSGTVVVQGLTFANTIAAGAGGAGLGGDLSAGAAAPVTIIAVQNQQQLDAAIATIDASSNQTFDIVLTPASGVITLTQDMPLLNFGTNTVTINGGGAAIDGQGEYRGFFALSGQTTIENVTLTDLAAIGGAGGGGTEAGGGGAGLGGGLYVAAGATVNLANVAFNDDSAVGGAGGVGEISDTYDYGGDGGGGGGLGGAGGAGDGTFGAGGGGGGVGTGATGGGASGGAGDADGSGSAGAGGGTYTQTTYYLGPVSAGTIDDDYNQTLGGGDGGGGGGGYGGEAGGGGGGINGQASAAYLAGSYTQSISPGDLLALVTGGDNSILSPIVSFVETLAAAATDAISSDDEDDGGEPEAGDTNGRAGSGEFGLTDYLEAADDIVDNTTALLGITASSGNTNGDPTSGGAGGYGGGGGGGAGAGGDGGFGGGGGAGGGPLYDDSGSIVASFAGGAGGFGGGGGGGGLDASGGDGGFGAGRGTDGFADIDGAQEAIVSDGGGGLGAGGAVFVQQGGQLTLGDGVTFSGNTAQGGSGYNPGDAAGANVFLQGAQTLALDPSAGETTSIGAIGDQASAEAGYSLDKSGIEAEGAGVVELGGINLYSGPTDVGNPLVGAANEADPGDIVPNGNLEIMPGALVSNLTTIEAYDGGALTIDAGAVVSANIDFSNIPANGAFTLTIDPGAYFTGSIVNFNGPVIRTGAADDVVLANLENSSDDKVKLTLFDTTDNGALFNTVASGQTSFEARSVDDFDTLLNWIDTADNAAAGYVIDVDSGSDVTGGVIAFPELTDGAAFTVATSGDATLANSEIILPPSQGLTLQSSGELTISASISQPLILALTGALSVNGDPIEAAPTVLSPSFEANGADRNTFTEVDGLGNSITLDTYLTHTAADDWTLSVFDAATGALLGAPVLSFGANGALLSAGLLSMAAPDGQPLTIDVSGLSLGVPAETALTGTVSSDAAIVSPSQLASDPADAPYDGSVVFTTPASLGTPEIFQAYFAQTGANTWSVTVYNEADASPGGGFPYSAGPVASETLVFNADGTVQQGGNLAIPVASGQSYDLNLLGVTQTSSNFTASSQVAANGIAFSGVLSGAEPLVSGSDLYATGGIEIPDPGLTDTFTTEAFAFNGVNQSGGSNIALYFFHTGANQWLVEAFPADPSDPEASTLYGKETLEFGANGQLIGNGVFTLDLGSGVPYTVNLDGLTQTSAANASADHPTPVSPDLSGNLSVFAPIVAPPAGARFANPSSYSDEAGFTATTLETGGGYPSPTFLSENYNAYFFHTAANTWDLEIYAEVANSSILVANEALTFSLSGQLAEVDVLPLSGQSNSYDSSTQILSIADDTIQVDLSGLTQNPTGFSVAAATADVSEITGESEQEPVSEGGGLVIQGPGATVLDGASSFSAGITIESGTLELASPAAAGTGAVVFAPTAATAGAVLQIDEAAGLGNTIDGFAVGDTIDLADVAPPAQQTGVTDANGVLSLPGSSATLQFGAAGSAFRFTADGNGGTDVSLIQTNFQVPAGSAAAEAAAFTADVAALSQGGDAYVPGAVGSIALPSRATITVAGAIDLDPAEGALDTLIGDGATLDATNGIALQGGTLVLQSLTLQSPVGAGLTVAAGATAELAGGAIGGTSAVAAGGALVLDAGTLSGAVTLAADATFDVEPAPGDSVALDATISGNAALTVGVAGAAAGGVATIGAASSFTGGTDIVGPSTVEIAAGASLGTGAITLASPGATLEIDGASLPGNVIDLAAGVGMIDLTGLGAATDQSVALGAGGQLNFTVAGDDETLAIGGVAAGTLFDVAPDGAGGTDVFLAARATTVATVAEFAAAANEANAAPSTTDAQSYVINLARGAGTLTFSQPVALTDSSATIADAAGPGAAATLAVGPGSSLTLDGTSSFAGGVDIGNAASLTLLDAAAAGTGAIAFTGYDATLVAAAAPANALAGITEGDVIDLKGVAGAPATIDANVDDQLAIAGTNGAATLNLDGIAPGTPFSLTPDGNGGTDVTTVYGQQTIAVANLAQLESAIEFADGLKAGSDVAVTISIAAGADIDLTQDLPAISLAQGVIVDLEGNGATIDGQETAQGLVADGGELTVQDLTIQNTVEQGGDGGDGVYGGGGGAGLGGGLFVGSGAEVTLSDVDFANTSALGGAGGMGTGTVEYGVGGGFDGGPAAESSSSSATGFGQGGIGSQGGFGGGDAGATLAVLDIAPYGFDGNLGGAGNEEFEGNPEAALGEGGGGLGAGGAIFVQAGGSVTVDGSGSQTGGTAVGGAGAEAGRGYGQGIFFQGDNTLTFAPAAGATIDYADAIADETASPTDQQGTVGVLVDGPGTVELDGVNSYAGATTIAEGTLELATLSDLTGDIVNDGDLVIDPAAPPPASASLFAPGSTVTISVGNLGYFSEVIGGDGTLADLAAAVNAAYEGSADKGTAAAALIGALAPYQPDNPELYTYAGYDGPAAIYDAATATIVFPYFSDPGPSQGNQIFAGVSGDGIQIYDSAGVIANDLVLGNAGGYLTLSLSQTQEYQQTITGTGNVTLDGAAGTNLVLTSAPGWTGSTTVAAGNTLTLPAVPAGAIDNEGALYFTNAAAITVGGLVNNGYITLGGASVDFTGPVAGSGSFSFAGTTQTEDIPQGPNEPAELELVDVPSDATLTLSDPASTLTLHGFAPGASLDLGGFQGATTTESFDATTDVLSLSDGEGHAVAIQLDADDAAEYSYALGATADGVSVTPYVAAPTITGYSNAGAAPDVTSSVTQTITGTAAPGGTVTLTNEVLTNADSETPGLLQDYAYVFGTAVANSQGQWSITGTLTPAYFPQGPDDALEQASIGYPVDYAHLSATVSVPTGFTSGSSEDLDLTLVQRPVSAYVTGATTLTNGPASIQTDIFGDWTNVTVLDGTTVVGSLNADAGPVPYLEGGVPSGYDINVPADGAQIQASDFNAETQADVPVVLTGANGEQDLTVEVTDVAGNVVNAGSAYVDLDTTVPPTPTVSLQDDTSDGADITTDAAIVLSGTPGDAATLVGLGGTYTFTFGGGPGTAPNGTFTVSYPNNSEIVFDPDVAGDVTSSNGLVDAPVSYSVTETSPAGNVSAPAQISYTYDTEPPIAPTIAFASPVAGNPNDSASAAVDIFTDAPGIATSVYDGATLLASGTANAQGYFDVTLPDNGTYQLTAVVTSAQGTTAQQEATLVYDDTPPKVTLALADDTGGNGITTDDEVLVTADPDTLVSISGAGAITSVETNAQGDASFEVQSANPLQSFALQASETNVVGIVGASEPLSFTLDSRPAYAPEIQLSDVTSGEGAAYDAATTDPALSLIAYSGSTVQVYDGTTLLGTATQIGPETAAQDAAAAGTYNITSADGGADFAFTPTLPDGTYSLTAVQTTEAGVTSAASNPVTFQLDTGADASQFGATLPAVVNIANAAQVAYTLTGPFEPGDTADLIIGDDTFQDVGGYGGLQGSLDLADAGLADGQYVVDLEVFHASGVATDDDVGSLALKLTPPVTSAFGLAIDATAKGALDASDETDVGYTVAGLADGTTGVITFSDGTHSLTQSVAENGSGTVDLSGFNGTVTGTLVASDSAGNTATTTASVLAEISPPAAPSDISLLDVADGSAILEVSGLDGDGVQYSTDGQTYLTAAVPTPGDNSASFLLPISAGYGDVTVYLRAIDAAGNVSASTPFSFAYSPLAIPPLTVNVSTDGHNIQYTNNPFVTITGESSAQYAGATVTLFEQQGSLGSAVVQPDGSWSTTIDLATYNEANAPPDGEGVHEIFAKMTAGYGNEVEFDEDLDYTAPTPTIALVNASTQSGSNFTNQLTFTGSGEFPHVYTGPASPLDDSVSIYEGSTFLTTARLSGPFDDYTVNLLNLPGVTFDDGIHTFTVSETNPEGTTGSASITVDYEAHSPPITIALADDTGGDSTTYDDTVTGTAAPNASVSFFDQNGDYIGSTAANASGAYSYDLNTPFTISPSEPGGSPYIYTGLATGTYSVTATATDPAGNVASTALTFTYDSATPTVSLALVDPSFAPNFPQSDLPAGYSVSTSRNIALTGHASDASTVTLSLADDEVLATIPVNPDGSFSYTPDLPDGAYTIDATATNAAGRSTTYSLTVTQDTAPPPLSVWLRYATPGTTLTADDLLEVAGGSLPATVIVTDTSSSGVVTQQASDVSSEFPAQFDFGATGVNQITAVETDLYGNTSTVNYTYTYDPTIPVVTLTTPSDATGATNQTLLTGTATVDPGSTVVIRQAMQIPSAANGYDDDWTVIGTPTPDASGNFSFNVDPSTDGQFIYDAVETTPVGVSETSDLAVLDFYRSADPTGSLTLDDSFLGADEIDYAIGGRPQELSTITPDTVLTFTDQDGDTIVDDIGASDGGTVDVSSLAPGLVTVSALYTDQAGNQALVQGATLDTAPPSPAFVGANGGDITQTSLTLSGTDAPSDAGLTVTIWESYNSAEFSPTRIASTTVQSNGSWTIPITLSGNGTYQFQATIANPVNYTSGSSAYSGFYALETASPPISLQLPDLGDATTGLTHSGVVDVAGASNGAAITVTDYGKIIAQGTISNGEFQFDLPTSGTYQLVANSTDPFGNTATSSLVVTYIAQADIAPVTLALTGQPGSQYENGEYLPITNNPAIAGTAEAGATVAVTYSNTATGQDTVVDATADANGHYIVDPVLADGTYFVTAMEDDSTGYQSLPVQFSDPAAPGNADFILNTSAPTTTLAIDGDPSGAPAALLTQIPTLTGTTEPDSTVTFSEGATTIGVAVAGNDGVFTFTPATLTDGAQTISAVATDQAGNVGAATSVSFTLDATGDASGAFDVATTGLGNGQYTYTLDGLQQGFASATVVFTDASGQSVAGVASANGTGGAADLSSLTGPISVSGTASYENGPDETLASGPVLDLGLAAYSEVAGDDYTTAPALTGFGAPDSTVTLLQDDAVVAVVATDASGAFSYDPTLADGDYTFTALQADASGAVDSSTLSFDLESAPPVIAITSGDGTDSTGRVTISGTTDPSLAGQTVTIYDGTFALNQASELGTVAADGTWSANVVLASDGVQSLTAVVDDQAGLQGVSNAVTYSPAAFAGVTITDGDAFVSGDDYVLTGTSSVDNGYIYLTTQGGEYTSTETDGSGNWSYYLPIGTGPGYYPGSYNFQPLVLVEGPNRITAQADNSNSSVGATVETTLTVGPDIPPPVITAITAAGELLPNGIAYTKDTALTLSGTAEAGSTVAVIDQNTEQVAGVTTAGANGLWSLNYNVPGWEADGSVYYTATSTDAAGNVENSLTGYGFYVVTSLQVRGQIDVTGATAVALQGGAPVALLAGNPYIEDVDGPGTLVSAAVSISGTADSSYQPGDILAADTQGTAITASYAYGVLSLTGDDTIADYERVLGSVTYQDSDTSTGGPATRSFGWTASDGTGDEIIGAETTIALDRPPVLTNETLDVDAFAGVPIVSTAAQNVLAVGNASDLAGDYLTVTAVDGTAAGVGEAVAGTDGSLILSSDGSFTYTPESDAAPTDSFTYTVDDGEGGEATGTLTFIVQNGGPAVTASANAPVVQATLAAGAIETFTGSVSDLADGGSDPIVYTEQLEGGGTQVVQSGQTFAIGVHTIIASATDSQGKTGTSSPFTFSVVDTSISVAEFLADQAALDVEPGGFAIADTAANVSTTVDTLNADPNLNSITLTDTGTPTLTLTAAQALNDTNALGKISNSTYDVAISDTGANVQADLAYLAADADVTTIALTGGALTETVAEFTADQTALDKVVSGFAIADTAANVSTIVDTLNADPNLNSITLTDTGAPTLTLTTAQALNDTNALGKISNSTYDVAISDTGANVQADLAYLAADAHVTTIALTGGALTETVAEFTADQTALDKVASGFAIADKAANVSTIVDTLNADPNLNSITLTDTGAPTLTLTAAQALNDTNALGKISNSTYDVAISDTAANVQADLAYLAVDAHVTTIALTGGALTETVAEFTADQTALDKVASDFAISDTAANVQAALASLAADPHITTIRSYNPDGSYQIAYADIPNAAYTETVQYGSNGELTSVSYSTGETETWSYNPDGSYQIAYADIPNAAYAETVQYGSNGEPTSVSYSTGETETWSYNPDGSYQIAYADIPNAAYAETVQYGSSGELTSVSYSTGETETWSYNPDGSYQIAYADIPNAAYTETVQYGSSGELTSVSYSTGETETWSYNPDGSYQIAYADIPNAAYAETVQYGSDGELTSVSYSTGETETWSYNPDGSYQIAYADIPNAAYAETVQYGSNGEPTSVSYSTGETETWSYNPDGSYQIAYADIPNAAYTETVQYGSNGEPTSVSYSNGETATWSYNPDGSYQIAYSDLQGLGYSSYESLYNSAAAGIAAAQDLTNGSGNLLLYGNGLTVSESSGQQSVTTGSDTFAINPHGVETIAESGGNNETFEFASGFGNDAITGLVATGATHDVIRFNLSMFSSLTPTMTQAQDVATLLAGATQNGANLAITDSAGDVLTLNGITETALNQNPNVFRFT